MTNLQSDMSSFMPENDFVELLLENGQMMMQGQSNRSKKPNISTVFPSITSRTTTIQEKYVGGSPKAGRIDSVVNDLSPAAPSTGLKSLDDDIVPWMNYPLQSDYCSDFFSEFTWLYGNSLSNSNKLGGITRELQNVEHGHSTKMFARGIDCSKSKLSRTPEVGGSSNSNAQQRLQKVDVPISKPLQTSSGTGVMNFSHFSRPIALVKANLENVDRLRSNKKASTTMSSNPIEYTLVDPAISKSVSAVQEKLSPVPPLPPPLLQKLELRSTVSPNKEVTCLEDTQRHGGQSCSRLEVFNTHLQGSSQTPIAAEKGPEAVVASSVCSGNSAGVNDVKQRGKRKNQEGDESGYWSEDLEGESIGVKNPAMGKGATAKRSRAAEVHNLSERRRRDRINERMRALQELIPNCNKADKASMLDEAIEYLKTLQLQLQIMSTGSSLCLPLMMLPTGMQHLRGPPLAHFPPPMNLGMGMGMGMGYGMGMVDMNGSPGWQLPGMGMPGSSNVQMLGIPGQFGMGGSSMARPPPHFAFFRGSLIKGPEISGTGPSSTPQGDTTVQQHVNVDRAEKSSGFDAPKSHAQV